jgi:hypothetical protein
MKSFLSLFAQQIASAVVDQPYSGFLVNQSIEEELTVLEWETERASVPAGTVTLSMPSGLASNKQSVLFVAVSTDSTLTLTTRNYADSADNTFICDILADEPFYAVLQNIKSATVTTTASLTGIQSFVAKVSPTATSGSTSPTQGLDPGSLPVGGIIALSGTFATDAPLAGYSEAGILPLPSYLQLCDGSLCSDSDSIFFGKFVPDITGNKTLFGSTTAGQTLSSSTSATVLTGFGVDWNIFQAIDVAAAYSVKFYIRIK